MVLDHYGYGLGGWVPGTAMDYQSGFTAGSDLYWMAMALAEGMKAVGKAPPNPIVGCVFVKDQKLLAKGATEEFGGRHGERVAASRLKEGEARGGTVYVTLEPCCHTGKQPPCAQLLVELGIKRCVMAMVDPFHKVNGRGIRYLEKHGVKVEVGVMAKEAMAWHLPFLFSSHYRRPLLVGKWAQTFDGHLADDQGGSQWISGQESRAYTHFLRQKYDAIMVGSGTVIADIPSLNVRDCRGPINRSPVKIIIDPKGRILSIDSEIQRHLIRKTFAGEPTIYCGPEHKSSWLSHVDMVHSIELKGPIDADLVARLNDCYQSLKDRPLQSIFVEGGPSLLNRLIGQGLIDVFHTFQRPSILGGHENRLGTAGKEPQRRLMAEKQDLYLLASIVLGQDIVVESLSQALANDIWKPGLESLHQSHR
ncbi:diaminohydroxyphosphoribosylaminopyrimidine deaminase [Pseudobacteriovorax antillogorgiicola]|uniref:Riboflavin biosynthesis protein RibD n=2 Tax=Pseudobacteriovorax antillogorgiicola TaxID=1513793 RepID=A0A1Y6B6T2_9BACT|nr:diaminohydroxyphosphoribosylaminopyrimidine deaminase [Pseudobacteriovorax antillogorgiicola]SME93793.1 diaminohydroxyphosphoribosylaminopyrimidine deaminase [Pseudobacteriovorax antillogorgiicola]